MYSGRTTTTVSAPSGAPIDLNTAGKPDWRELGPMIGLTLILLLPAGAGGALIVANWPRYAGMTGWQALWLGLGAALAIGSGLFFKTLSHELMRAVRSYNDRVEMWNDAVLDKYIEGDGMVTAHQISEWSYTENDMRHVALAVLWLLLAQPKSLSIEKLTKGPILMNVGHRAFKMLDMTYDGATNFLNLLDRAGIVEGRGPRTAGTIAILDPRTAALKILAEASRNPAMIGSEEG